MNMFKLKNKRKLIILILSLMLIQGLYAQEKLKKIMPLKNGKVIYTNVVQTDSVSKFELYQRARRWLAYNYELIKLDDKEELVGRGYVLYSGQTYVWNTIKIQMKNGRYRYEIADFIVKPTCPGDETSIDSPNFGKGFYITIDAQINALILSLEKAMKTALDDNW